MTAVAALLNELESRELRSLTWGFVDGGYGYDDLESRAEHVIDAFGERDRWQDGEELVEFLLEQRLLFEIRGAKGEELLRSRFAETVRLLGTLRQLFPQKDWRAAPRLVADFRIDVKPRLVVERSHDPSVVRGELQETTRFGDIVWTAWKALVESDSAFKLATFQVAACRTLFDESRGDRGVVITAGTGTGKSLAFYLPVFSRLAGSLERKPKGPQVIAIYPRTELLKDQLTTAVAFSTKIFASSNSVADRPIRIGALFGDIPWRWSDNSLERMGWRRAGTKWICPIVRCPQCNGELLGEVKNVFGRAIRTTLPAVRTCRHIRHSQCYPQ